LDRHYAGIEGPLVPIQMWLKKRQKIPKIKEEETEGYAKTEKRKSSRWGLVGIGKEGFFPTYHWKKPKEESRILLRPRQLKG